MAGDNCFDDGRWSDAIYEYKKLLEKNKNQPEIFFKLGNAYYKKGDMEKAIEAFTAATQLKPDFLDAYQKLSEVSMQIAVPENEIKVCLKEVQKNPNSADAHFRLGVSYYKCNIFMDAKREYEIAVGLDPKKTEAYFNLGVLYQDLNTYDKAEETYKKAIGISQSYDKAHFNLGIVYYQTGRLEESASEYKQVISVNPDYADAYVNLSLVYFIKSFYFDAIESLKKALPLGSAPEKIHYFCGNIYNKMDKKNDAIAEYKKAIKINSKMIAPRYNLGLIYLEKKMVDEAIEEFTRAIVLDHDYANAYLNRCKAYELKDDLSNAQSDYNSYQHAKAAFARFYKEEIRSPFYAGSNSAE